MAHVLQRNGAPQTITGARMLLGICLAFSIVMCVTYALLWLCDITGEVIYVPDGVGAESVGLPVAPAGPVDILR